MESKTEASDEIPPSQSSSIEFHPLSPLQIISSPSTQSTDSQSSRQRALSGGFSQSPTPFQHITTTQSSQSPRRYQPFSSGSSQSPGHFRHLSGGGSGTQSPGQRQRYKSGSGGCSSDTARPSQEDMLNQSLGLADAADTSLGLLDAGILCLCFIVIL